MLTIFTLIMFGIADGASPKPPSSPPLSLSPSQPPISPGWEQVGTTAEIAHFLQSIASGAHPPQLSLVISARSHIFLDEPLLIPAGANLTIVGEPYGEGRQLDEGNAMQEGNALTIDAQGLVHHFDVGPGSSLTLRSLHLTRGASSVAGGTLKVRAGGKAVLIDTRITASSTMGPVGEGGAIWVEGALVMSHTTISDCRFIISLPPVGRITWADALSANA